MTQRSAACRRDVPDQRLDMKVGPEHPARLSTAQCGRAAAGSGSPAAAAPPRPQLLTRCLKTAASAMNSSAVSPTILRACSRGSSSTAKARQASSSHSSASHSAAHCCSRGPTRLNTGRRREVRQLGDALNGRRLVRRLAQQLADRLENPLTALAACGARAGRPSRLKLAWPKILEIVSKSSQASNAATIICTQVSTSVSSSTWLGCRGRRAAGGWRAASRARRRRSRLPPRSAIGRSARSPIHVAKPVNVELTSCSTAARQQLRPVARVGGEDAQQLGLAVELGEDVACGQGQFGFEVAQRAEHVADLAQRVRAARAGARCRRRAPLPCSGSGGRCRRLLA